MGVDANSDHILDVTAELTIPLQGNRPAKGNEIVLVPIITLSVLRIVIWSFGFICYFGFGIWDFFEECILA
ncbi:hypothetical protein AMJ83_03845 [candidate division WOR_3 bacterium SM23_42]|uniref:Uncharacterized protein n=1 Tax=candidate division WOR_3 bacterium SM23_42 TaxID=1703779 RepID=A0A0S8FVK4_UNCW3|nr:MAG: hypothetical protein AMJ83_03845 [candidate division WOR_3 bacterium SM23_42]